MNGRLWIRGGRVLDPGRALDALIDLVVEDGRLLEVGTDSRPAPEDEVLDATGQVVVPGFVDTQARLGEPGFEHRETLRSGLEAGAAGGFTAVACLAATDPVIDERSVVDSVLREAERVTEGARLLPFAALSKRRGGEELTEMGELAEAGAVAFSDAPRPSADPSFFRRALLYARHYDVPVVERPEDSALAGSGVMHEGGVSARLGLPGIPAIAEELAVARAVILAEETGGRLHLAPVSTARSLDLIREAKARGVAVTCATTIHHCLLTDEDVARSVFSPAVRVDPPLRPEADVVALLAGLADGTIDALVSDHAPWHVTEKEVPFSDSPAGIAGLETLVPLALDRLVGGGHLTLVRLVELLADGPRRILGLPGGCLKSGQVADVTILDPAREIRVDGRSFRSRARNTPFSGEKVRGGVAGVLVGGTWIPARANEAR